MIGLGSNAINRARMLAQTGQHEEAVPLLRTHVAAHAADGAARLLLAECLYQAQFIQEAESVFGGLCLTTPSIRALNGHGLTLAALNRHEAAEKGYLAVLEQTETIGIVWRNLASVHRFRPGDTLLKRMRKLARSGKLPPDDRRDLCFAMAKAMNDLGDWTQAWDWAARGADLAPQPFDPGLMDQELDAIRRVYTPDFLARSGARAGESAVFIVGMPRSGTSLVEAILARHPSVKALGELPTLPALLRASCGPNPERERHDWVGSASDEALGALGKGYLDRVKARTGGTLPCRFTDKLPGNLALTGLVARALPGARVIRMRRDPLDTGVSCYLRRFSNGLRWTQRPEWIASAYAFFEQAGDHLGTVLPQPMLEVSYEALVADPEPQIRRLLDFVGLPWDSACLTPEEADHAVTSASSTQVRQAISASSVGRWRRYGDRAGPLANAMGLGDPWRAAA